MGHKEGIEIALNNMGSIYLGKGDYDQALDLYNQSLKLAKEMGHQEKMIATTLDGIAMIYLNKGKYNQALDLFSQSLKLAKKIGNQDGIARYLNNIGLIYSNKGDYENALYYIIQGHDMLKKLDAKSFQWSLNMISNLREKLGKEIANNY